MIFIYSEGEQWYAQDLTQLNQELLNYNCGRQWLYTDGKTWTARRQKNYKVKHTRSWEHELWKVKSMEVTGDAGVQVKRTTFVLVYLFY